jgi:FixJ family two-component response regulator
MPTAYLESPTVRAPFSNRLSHSGFVMGQPTERATRDTVYLIGRRAQKCAQLKESFARLGVAVLSFATASEYLDHNRCDTSACLVVDVHLPDASGLELQQRLAEEQHPPLIFVAGDCDIRLSISAMKAGALEFLTEPIDRSALMDAIRAAIIQDRRARQKEAELTKLRARYNLLTPREREVFPIVVGGLLNKQSAALLDISEVTLQIHRSQVMKKMAAESFADLVRMAVKLKIPYWREDRPCTPAHLQTTSAHKLYPRNR